MTTPRYGDFAFQTVVDAYEPRLADLHPSEPRHGLSLQVQYFYGGLRDAEGVTYAVERKFCGPMTGGLWLMEDSTHDLNLVPQALTSAQGNRSARSSLIDAIGRTTSCTRWRSDSAYRPGTR